MRSHNPYEHHHHNYEDEREAQFKDYKYNALQTFFGVMTAFPFFAGIVACALFLLVSCTSDNDYAEQQAAAAGSIQFGDPTVSAAAGSVTRAAAGVIDNEGAGTNIKLTKTSGFGVFGCNTGLHKYAASNVQPNFMYNQQVSYNESTGKWTYSPVKYWPNGEGETLPDADATGNGTTAENPHYVSFFAYAPYSTLDGSDPSARPQDYCVSALSYQHEITNPWLTYRLIPQAQLAEGKQIDLLCAKPLLDQQKPQTGERLKFQFQHALACVTKVITISLHEQMQQNLKARLGESIGGMEVVLTSLTATYELTEHARLTLWNNGTPNWTPLTSGELTTERYVDYSNLITANPTIYKVNGNGVDEPTVATEQWTDDTKGVFYIPTHITPHTQTVTFTIGYEIRCYRTGSTEPVTKRIRSIGTTVNLSDYPEAYQPGMCLNFGLVLNDNTDNTLTLTAAISDWDNTSNETHNNIHAD